MNTSERRRTERILAPVRIRVIGNDMSGVSFAEETVTVSFNQQGARISLIHSLLPDDVVLVKNLENGIEEEFRVVGAFQQVFGTRREWGVEAVNPESGIWGVEFAPTDDSAQPKVLVECAACKTAAQSTLSSIEYEVLLGHRPHLSPLRALQRNHPLEAQRPNHDRRNSGPIQQGCCPRQQTTRRTRRLKLTMQLRVRNAWGVVDIAQTRDVSKAGLCFISSQRFSPGDEVYITLPYAQNQAPVETQGKVIWMAEGASSRFYGVEYIR